MLSLPHLIIIFLIALMVFGPEKLPELARMLGKAMAEFRRMTGDVRRVMDDEMREIERQTRENETRKRDAAAAAQSQPAALPAADSVAETLVPSGTAQAEPPTIDRPTIDQPTIDRPTGGKAEALAMEPAPETEIEQDFSHVKHNPS
jgi:TatA/E family protein of Tat protein translocase